MLGKLFFMHKIPLFVSIILISGLVACVPKRKLDEMQARFTNEKTQREELTKKVNTLDEDITALNKQIDEQNKRMEVLKKDTSIHGNSYRLISRNYDQLDKTYRELLEAQERVKKGSQEEARRLLIEIEQTRRDLQEKEDQLNRLQFTLTEKENSLAQLENTLKDRESRVKELQSIVNQQDSASKALRNKLQSALLGFQDKGLTVNMRNGKVYISLENELMFRSGSWEVGTEGKKALTQLAEVLIENPDIDILVEGHTDTDKFTGRGDLKDNWDLSVKRATEIVKILENNKVNPTSLTAAGRGEHIPLISANTPDAKKKNRRTEIILSPKLNELFNLLDN